MVGVEELEYGVYWFDNQDVWLRGNHREKWCNQMVEIL